MTDASLDALTTDQLVARYVEAAAAHGAAPNSRVANNAAETIASIYDVLRARDERSVLLILLEHPDPAVRVWAGAHGLEISPQEALDTLQDIAAGEGAIAFNAEATIEVWRRGELKFP
jgi:hypothetical protein